MAYKQTLAIIGAATAAGPAVAAALAGENRLLLMDRAGKDLAAVATAIKRLHPQADLEVIGCCKEASWEADGVVITVEKHRLEEVAAKLHTVTNCKPVVHLAADDADAGYLKAALPHAKMVSIRVDTLAPSAVMHGTDTAALEIAEKILNVAVGQSYLPLQKK